MPRAKTQADIKTLSELYIAARKRLLNTVLNPRAGIGTKTYANTILRQLTRELNAMRAVSDDFIDTTIPAEYRAGLRDTYGYFKRNKLMMRAPSAFASLHHDAIYVIAREMQYQIGEALSTVGRRASGHVGAAMDEALRLAGLRHVGIKAASGGTIRDMRNALLEELKDEGFLALQYGEGNNVRQVPIDVYASMVARSTSREAGNTARLNQLMANGYDLVQMSSHYPTCGICAPLQGRVYSISGRDKRFPPLSKAFGAYNNVHPNCRHVIAPWIESMHSAEEIEKAVAFSNRPFSDERSQAEVYKYKEQQDKARRLRNDLYQWERYKAVLGEDAPKSAAAFRRIKNAEGISWERLQWDYRFMQRYAAKTSADLLPRYTDAIDIAAKLEDYVLDPTHPTGKHKALVFESALGYNLSNRSSLEAELRRGLGRYKAIPTGNNGYGETYRMKLLVSGPKGRQPVSAGWIIRDGEDFPRMVTAYVDSASKRP